ncbi:hypothetical protein CJ030_MR8G021804 [Morella rubra]|uniref:CCDC93 N-terminal domain-containing protein n=1 Tax=Morella rubra TaxID=262757 RepID=A0A6A1UVT0_9ROSI|nr:hypothetical protein CJ030_MR8G021804 [Morella rubra]
MADSHSLPEAVSPSALGPIYDLLLSVGYADAGKTDVSGFNRVSGGLAWCISTVNDETLTSQDEMHVTGS